MDASLGDLISDDSGYDFIRAVHDLLDRHINTHLVEPASFIFDGLHDEQFSHDLVAAIQRDILDVYHDLVHRNAC